VTRRPRGTRPAPVTPILRRQPDRKEREPFPVPIAVYDRTIAVLKSAVAAAKLGNDERLDAIRRLDDQARRLERVAGGPSLPEHVATERQRSHEYGGRSVFGWQPAPAMPRHTR
jgi:hypothetical protein